MFKPKTKKLNILILTAILIVAVLGCAKLVTAGNNGNSFGYAFSEKLGWIRFDGTDSAQDYGVTVSDTILTGYAWSENAGWIQMASLGASCLQPGGGCTASYAYNVANDTTGTCVAGWGCLSGYAWGEGVGWIRFAATGSDYSNTSDTNYGVYIDSNGNFKGYAWSEQAGWVHFGGSCDEAGGCPSGLSNYGVGTSLAPPIAGDTLAGINITATGGNIVIANNNITVTSSTGDGHKGILVSGVGVTADIFGNKITVSGDGTSHYGIEARSANVTLLRNTINAEDIDVVANVDGLIVTSGQNRLVGSGINFSVKSSSGVIESSNDYYITVSNSGTFRDLTGVRQYTYPQRHN